MEHDINNDRIYRSIIAHKFWVSKAWAWVTSERGGTGHPVGEGKQSRPIGRFP